VCNFFGVMKTAKQQHLIHILYMCKLLHMCVNKRDKQTMTAIHSKYVICSQILFYFQLIENLLYQQMDSEIDINS